MTLRGFQGRSRGPFITTSNLCHIWKLSDILFKKNPQIWRGFELKYREQIQKKGSKWPPLHKIQVRDKASPYLATWQERTWHHFVVITWQKSLISLPTPIGGSCLEHWGEKNHNAKFCLKSWLINNVSFLFNKLPWQFTHSFISTFNKYSLNAHYVLAIVLGLEINGQQKKSRGHILSPHGAHKTSRADSYYSNKHKNKCKIASVTVQLSDVHILQEYQTGDLT